MIILCGASASGKTEVAKLLSTKYGIKKVVTNTTRKMRPNEINGVDYHFTSKEEFLELKNTDYFVETTIYNDNYYGCSKKEVSDDKCVILEPEGVNNFLKLNNPHIVTFGLYASKKTRRERMMSRGDTTNNIISRLEQDEHRFSLEALSFSDFLINTDDKTIEEVTLLVLYLYKNKLEEINNT